MSVCEVCHNEYDKSFKVTTADGRTYDFDSFECAIQLIAPSCAHCGCRLIGHGVESSGIMFCCVTCASHEGVDGLK
ncbi:MAG: hypothetical protein ACRDIA_08950, partial [Actinomycetota bacterium]